MRTSSTFPLSFNIASTWFGSMRSRLAYRHAATMITTTPKMLIRVSGDMCHTLTPNRKISTNPMSVAMALHVLNTPLASPISLLVDQLEL